MDYAAVVLGLSQSLGILYKFGAISHAKRCFLMPVSEELSPHSGKPEKRLEVCRWRAVDIRFAPTSGGLTQNNGTKSPMRWE